MSLAVLERPSLLIILSGLNWIFIHQFPFIEAVVPIIFDLIG